MKSDYTTPGKFGAFMKKRHDIYLARKAGKPGPWTDDPVLRDGRFCNVYRELDTVTQWIHKHIRVPFADHPDLWFMLAIARYINWPPTLQYLMENYNAWPDAAKFTPSNIGVALQAYAEAGNKVYTGAYMIRAESHPAHPWYSWSKHRYIAEIVLGRLWEDRAGWTAWLKHFEDKPGHASLQSAWLWFQVEHYIGWGPFMAYEVVTDWRHTRYLNQAHDIYRWANAGPGAIRGLNRLHDRHLNNRPSPKQTADEMFELMVYLNKLNEPEFNETFGPPTVGLCVPDGGYLPSQDVEGCKCGDTNLGGGKARFEMRDIEHSLCEYDKYQRVKLNEGKMRSKYDWRKATDLTKEI
jgi:hypothetical protein